MIAYVDSSLLTRAYLPDEEGHEQARALLTTDGLALVTGRLTRIEVSGALARAVSGGRHPSREEAFATLDSDLGADGRIIEVNPSTRAVEQQALALVREHGLRALDALHLATAVLSVPQLADKGEPIGFASRDGDQATVAESLGFATV